MLKNRIKSLLWRIGMMIVAVIVSAFLANIDILNPYISPAFVGVLGLILGEISKALNTYLSETK
jgi:hypothetical protein